MRLTQLSCEPTEELDSSPPKMNEDILRPNPESTPPGCRKR